MTVKIFIDGAAGTTGLEIRERLAEKRGIAVGSLEGVMADDAFGELDAKTALLFEAHQV